MANGDGHIVLKTKVDTEGIKKGQSDITSILSKTSNAVKAVGLKIQESFDKSSSIKLLTQSIEAQKYVIDELTKKYAQMVATQNNTGTEAQELKQQIDDLTKELKEMEFALDTISGKKSQKQIDGVTKGFSNMGKRLANIVKSALVFSVIYKGLRTMATTIKNVAMGNEEFRESVSQLQAALWVAFSPIINVIIPALKILVQWLTQAAIAVGKFFATISGKSYASMVANAKGLKQQSDNYKKLGKSAKDAKKQLAGFDEIQILSNDSSAGAGENAETGNIFENFTGEGEINATLTAIMGIVGGAMVALGVLLLFNGQVGWGIGFIIAGATSMGVNIAVIANSDLDIASKLSAIETIVGGFLLALGLVLFFKCASPTAKAIGLGMIISGAGVLSVGAAQMAANNIGGEIGNMLHGIIAIVSGFLLAIGLIMLFSGNISPLSIGLVVTGAVGLVSEATLYPEALKESLSGWLGIIFGIVSAALLVIGIIMCCTGNITPLSIGLIVAGAVGLASVVAINWDTIKEKATEIFDAIFNWIKTWGLLVLGIILCISGVGLPLGIALIKKGAGSLTEAQDPLWDTIVDKVKDVWARIKEFWNQHIAKWFTKEHWAGLAKNMMNGLIEKIEQGLNNLLRKFHKSGMGKALDYISGGLGFDIPSSISIPRLAKGAVIPPNREFLAVLGDQKQGTNIEAPAQLIKQMVTEAMIEMGGIAGKGNTEVVLELDGRELGRAVVEQGNRENRRIGTRLVVV